MTYTILYYVRIVWETSKIERNDLNESTGDVLNSLTLKWGSNNNNNKDNNNKQKIRLIWAIRSFVVMSLVSHLALTFRCCLNCEGHSFTGFCIHFLNWDLNKLIEHELNNIREHSEYINFVSMYNFLSSSLAILNIINNLYTSTCGPKIKGVRKES